jgi:hypothetical protein
VDYCELFLRYPKFKTKAITLSFDDGFNCDKEMAEILDKYGIKCTFNVNSGRIESEKNRVQFEEFASVYKNHEIACHSFTHPHFNNLDLGGVAYQIVKDRELLEEKTGKIVDGFAYPFGLWGEDEGMVDCIGKCGIKYGRTTVSTYNFELPTDYLRWNPTCHQADPKLFDLAAEFFAPDDIEHPWRIKPRLFYIWGHSFEYIDKWEKLEEMCEVISGKDNVWYATNGEIIDYVKAFSSLRRSANGKIVFNPTNVDLYVVANDQEKIIKSFETVVFD